MGDRMLRGSRLGAVSYESERNTELRRVRCASSCAPRATASRCRSRSRPKCRGPGSAKFDGSVARLVDGTEPEQKKVKPPRTHWDMLLERRSMAELDEILNERLADVRTRRGR